MKETHGGEWKVDETLTFHALDDQKFLSCMARCTGVATTAGFETVCEAYYLGKPVFMVPVAGHFEQYCNARDAHKAGAGIHDTRFRLGRFLDYLHFHPAQSVSFRYWVDKCEDSIMDVVRQLLPDGSSAPVADIPVLRLPAAKFPEVKASSS